MNQWQFSKAVLHRFGRGPVKLRFYRPVFALLTLLAMTSAAQEPTTPLTPGAAALVPTQGVAPIVNAAPGTAPALAAVAGAPRDVSDLVTLGPVESTFTPRVYIAPQVLGFLPRIDTNPAIGVAYPAGSREFVLLMAGITPKNRATITPSGDMTASLLQESLAPAVRYELAAQNSTALMTREMETTLVRNFPPGAAVHQVRAAAIPLRAARLPITGALVPYPEATMTATGEEVVQDFPPGATVARARGAR